MNNKLYKLSINEQESSIIDIAIIELGGPLHSLLAIHLLKFHEFEFENIKSNIEFGLEIKDILLIIDLVEVFLYETLDSDWGTIYPEIQKEDVIDFLAKLKKSTDFRIEMKKEENKISSKGLAAILVNSLIDTGFISKESFEKSVEIVTIEINARKGIGDY